MIYSYILQPVFTWACDIEDLPLRVCLGGKNLGLVSTDEENVPTILERGWFVFPVMPGVLHCAGRFMRIEDVGSMPVEVCVSEVDEAWCIDLCCDGGKPPVLI
jgi:hypothetical protein